MRARVVLVALLVVTAGLSGAVVAQESDQTTTTEEGGSDGEASQVVAEVDSQVRVTDYSYDADESVMSVTVEHVDEDGSTAALTMTEVISSRQGSSGSFGVETLELRPGETATVHVSAERVDGTAAVMIVSQESLQNGNGVFVRDGKESSSVWDGVPSWADVRAGAFFGITVTIGVMLIAAWYVVARKETNYQEVDVA